MTASKVGEVPDAVTTQRFATAPVFVEAELSTTVPVAVAVLAVPGSNKLTP